MTNSQQHFIWYELLTTDAAAAKTFYGNVVGWEAQRPPNSLPGVDYTLFTVGQWPVAGVMDLTPEARSAGAPPHWLGYIGVEDVDTTVERIRSLGGATYLSPRDIPNVGRFAIVGDPQGSTFALFKWFIPGRDQPGAPGAVGRVGWHELFADDWVTAFAFYAELFGWKKLDAVNVGAIGTYQIFSTGEDAIGGMFSKPPMVPAPFWLYYFNVAAIDAAIERVHAGGGQIINGPMEVPGGSWIVQCLDPQRAMFALVAPRR